MGGWDEAELLGGDTGDRSRYLALRMKYFYEVLLSVQLMSFHSASEMVFCKGDLRQNDSRLVIPAVMCCCGPCLN